VFLSKKEPLFFRKVAHFLFLLYTFFMGLSLILTLLFFITLIIFFGYSAVLLWQWKQYSTGKYTTVVHMFFYMGVSMIFLLIMLGGLLYTLNI
jgi:hypothetical protein